jgi:hypothetical protein
MTLRAPLATLLPLICALTALPAAAQDASVIGKDTVLPGTGPGTTTEGKSSGALMQAGSETDAIRRQGLKPATFLASRLVGVAVRNQAGESVGKIADLLITDGGRIGAVVIDVSGFLGFGGKRIAVEPGALVLRPGGDLYAAVLQMSNDTISTAPPFDPAKAIPAP